MSQPTPGELLDQTKCYACYGLSLAELFELGLLNDILAAGGGGNPFASMTVADSVGIPGGNMTALSFPVLAGTTVADVNFGNCTALASLLMPSLSSVNGVFSVFGASSLTSLNLPSLVSTGGVNCQGTTLLATFTAPLLSTTGAGDFLLSNALITSLSLPSLATVGANFDVESCPNLASLILSGLVTCGSALKLINLSPLTVISLPLLSTVASIDVIGNGFLTTVNFNSLTTVGFDVTISGNPNLTTFSAPNWLPTDGTSLDFSACALTAASVNSVLASCIASGVTTCVIDLSGGTNAAPTGQGLLDKAALILAGNTVTTN